MPAAAERLRLMLQPDLRMTEVQYLRFEERSETKHEFFDGTVRAIGGANERHEIVAIALRSFMRICAVRSAGSSSPT